MVHPKHIRLSDDDLERLQKLKPKRVSEHAALRTLLRLGFSAAEDSPQKYANALLGLDEPEPKEELPESPVVEPEDPEPAPKPKKSGKPKIDPLLGFPLDIQKKD